MRRVQALAFACFALVFASACLAPAASAEVVHLHGQFFGVLPHHGISPTAVPGAAAHANASALTSSGQLAYMGGPVVHSSRPYLLFWTPSGEPMPAGAEALETRYFTDVAAASGSSSNVYGVSREYYDGSGYADYAQSFNASSQVIVDTNSYPANGCTETDPTYYPKCLTDGQLQSELRAQISSRGLPTGIGPNAPIYFIVTPPDVNICDGVEDGVYQCADNVFCAYHSASQDGGATVLYAAMPFFYSTNMADMGQYAKECQDDNTSAIQEPNGNLADVALDDLSHEDNESITDPLGDAWWDLNSGNEEADNCAAYGASDPANGTSPNAYAPTLGGDATAGTLFDQLINGDPYYIQSEWSNGAGGCLLRPAAATFVPAFSVPVPGAAPVGSAATFNPGSTTSTYGVSSATWSFGDGSQPTFVGGLGALAPVSHTYAALGHYTVTLTLVDGTGNVSTISHVVTVAAAPRARFKRSPSRPIERSSVSFNAKSSRDPDHGVTLTTYRWSFGDGKSGKGAKTTHTYRRPGRYKVTLSVTNSLGAVGTTTHVVVVRPGIGAVSAKLSGVDAAVRVIVNAAGRISLAGHTVSLKRAGPASFVVALSGARNKLRLTIHFSPRHGKRETKTVNVSVRA